MLGGIKSIKFRTAGRQEQLLGPSLMSLLKSLYRDSEWSSTADRRYDLQITVWVRWVAVIGWLVVNNYRPDLDAPSYIPNNLIGLGVLLFNAYIHYRLRRGKAVSWECALALSMVDVIGISWGLLNSNGFFNGHYVLYYPALALFSVMFSSFAACLTCGILVSLVYAGISIQSVPNYSLDGDQETTLLVRILAMFVVIACVNLVARYERIRRRDAVAQALELQRERIELSRTIHDTVAQTTYMLSVGIETARRLANQSNQALINSLDATHSLAQTILWEIQAPLEGGQLFRENELGSVLRSHLVTFTDLTSIPVHLTIEGEEPPLSPGTKGLIFSIIHNSLTNVVRHSHATDVSISLEFDTEGISLSVMDNGVGLPEDYSGRGVGILSMLDSAEQLGGRLEVSSDRSEPGTLVTCWLPNALKQGGR